MKTVRKDNMICSWKEQTPEGRFIAQIPCATAKELHIPTKTQGSQIHKYDFFITSELILLNCGVGEDS